VNKEQIAQIYARSESYIIPQDVQSRITGSTLDLRALKFLGALIEAIGPVTWMEFGSGLSTFFTARLLGADSNAHIYSVDHSDYYMAQTQNACREHKNITFFYAPISPYRHKLKSFLTYKSDYAVKIPDGVKFDVVLIDGPLGFRYGREAPLYQIASHLKPETIIVLDDAGREPEQRAIANWRRVWRDKVSVEFFPGHKGLAVIQIHEPAIAQSFPFHGSEIWKSWYGVQERLEAEGGKIALLYSFIFFFRSTLERVRGIFPTLFKKIKKYIRLK